MRHNGKEIGSRDVWSEFLYKWPYIHQNVYRQFEHDGYELNVRYPLIKTMFSQKYFFKSIKSEMKYNCT